MSFFSSESIVVQVDFAENFKCMTQNEVQSAYFNQHSIAIFTVAVWIGEKKHSNVYVTDDISHSKYCVLLFLNEIISDMKSRYPNLKTVNFFSDGCAGQFKNRWILSLIVTANHVFGIDLSWDFFQSGHGKGAVDGIGGSAKRAVYQRIMSGNVLVYSAEEFSKCLIDNIKGISSTYIPVEQIKELEKRLSPAWKKVKAIPGLTKYFSYEKHTEKVIEAKVVGSSSVRKHFEIIS